MSILAYLAPTLLAAWPGVPDGGQPSQVILEGRVIAHLPARGQCWDDKRDQIGNIPDRSKTAIAECWLDAGAEDTIRVDFLHTTERIPSGTPAGELLVEYVRGHVRHVWVKDNVASWPTVALSFKDPSMRGVMLSPPSETLLDRWGGPGAWIELPDHSIVSVLIEGQAKQTGDMHTTSPEAYQEGKRFRRSSRFRQLVKALLTSLEPTAKSSR